MASCVDQTCQNCGGSTLQPDTHGALEILVCVECGASSEAQLGGDAEEFCPPGRNIQAIADGPLHQGKFYARQPYSKQKERNFLKLLHKMAISVHLKESETKLCIEEGLTLLRKGQIGYNMKNFAAGLVFIALERSSPRVSYKQVEKMVDVNYKIIGRTVKYLKTLPLVNNPRVDIPDEERMQEAIDRLPPTVTHEERIELKKIALDLKELCQGIRVQGFFMCNSHNQTVDYALLVIAMSTLRKEKTDDKWIPMLADLARVKESSLQTYLWKVKTVLVHLASQLPSVGSVGEITTRNVLNYISLILKYKNLLLINPDKESVNLAPLSEGTSSGSSSGVALLSADSYQPPPDDSDDNLSDLDPQIEEYIATRKEVAFKKKQLKKQS